MARRPAARRPLVGSLTRAPHRIAMNHERYLIRAALGNRREQERNGAWVVLTVPVHLYRDFVAMIPRPEVARLHRASDAEVHGIPEHHRAVRRSDGTGLVVRAVV